MEKINEESGDQEKVVAPPSPVTETTCTADSKAVENENESESRVEDHSSSVEGEVKNAESVAEEAVENGDDTMDTDDVAKTGTDISQPDEQMEVDATQPVETSSQEPVRSQESVEEPVPSQEPAPSCRSATNDPLLSKLAEVVKTVSETAQNGHSNRVDSDSTHKDATVSGVLSTENLISVLEGSTEKEPVALSTTSESKEVTSAVTTETPAPAPSESSKSQKHLASEQQPPKATRKYIYKLKSKTGKVLKYISSVPIVLKRPVITLTKMEDLDEEEETKGGGLGGKVARTDMDEVDSDNSTKENHVKANDASASSTGSRLARKRGRPPLSQKAPVVTLDDNSSEAMAIGDDKDTFKGGDDGASTPSYGVQTRKRQMKFLSDGRVVTPAGKKYKLAAAATAAIAVSKTTDESSDADMLTESDDGSQSDPKSKLSATTAAATKKFTPLESKMATEKRGNFKKTFNYESYFREKSVVEATKQTTAAAAKRVGSETPKNTSAKPAVGSRNIGASLPASSKSTAPPSTNNSLATPPHKNTVDPAQLLSSLIGATIYPHQLNVVKFKPKVIQDRKTMSAQKNVTFVDETSAKKNNTAIFASQQQRSTPFKVSAKPSLQKILPKPLLSPDRASTLIRKTMETPKSSVATPSAASRLATTTSKLNAALTSPVSVSTYGSSQRFGPAAGDAYKFENFTDTKVVKTKEGPKRGQKLVRQEDAEGEVKTIYDLVQNVFEQIPSWNLHIIPDTNSFCIAQVSRGRMGIPILKKSIELSAEFAAKVYVHQLHCKKYDGIYDSESKILSLIREIDALAA